MNWLNHNAGAIQALGSLVLVGVTTAYVVLTQRLVAETRNARRPYLYVDVQSDGASLAIGIGNSGDRAAEFVRFQVNEDFEGPRGVRLREMPPFENGIDYVPPGRRYDFVVDVGDEVMALGSSARIDLSVSYRSDSRVFEERVTMALSGLGMVDLRSFGEPTDRIADAIRRLPQDYFRSERSHRFLHRTSLYHCPRCGEPIRRADATKCPSCLEAMQPSSDVLPTKSAAESDETLGPDSP